MTKDFSELTRSVRQALLHIGRDKEIPEQNPLLSSPIVLRQLEEAGKKDTPEHRQEAIVTILKQIVSEYGLDEIKGQREQEQHQRVFEVLEYILLGGRKELFIASRSYDRYHAKGVKIIAQKIQRMIDKMLLDDTDSHILQEVRQRAQLIVDYINKYTKQIDLFALSELSELATIIEEHNYYGEAQTYFQCIIDRLENANSNLVVLRRRATATSHLAHCFMNQNKVDLAIQQFRFLNLLADQLNDPRTRVHSSHMLGVTMNMAGKWQAALALYDRAIEEAKMLSDREFRVAWIQRDQMTSLLNKGDFREIPNIAKQSFKVRERMNDTQGCLLTLEAWSRILILQQDYRQAQSRLTEALSAIDKTPSMLYRVMLSITLVDLHISMGDQSEASRKAKDIYGIIAKYGLWHQLERLNSILKKF